ncbi:GIY-YIG nuclease family protein, partial [Klebsiella pneumoniae]
MDMGNNKKYSIYILECCDGSYYTGITSDLQHRV